MSPTQLSQFFSQYTHLELQKGEIIIRAGDTPAGIYYLESGLVKMSTITLDGEELTLNIFKAGSFFPMSWAINQIPNTYYFQCITDGQAWRAPPDDVMEFLKAHPDILLDLTSRLYSGMWGLMSQMQHLMHGNADSKIINVLLMLASRFGNHQDDNQIHIDVEFTHQDIASLAGTSRETVTRLFSKLKRKKILHITDHHITVEDLPQLKQLMTPD